jgi:hypothetical protein
MPTSKPLPLPLTLPSTSQSQQIADIKTQHRLFCEATRQRIAAIIAALDLPNPNPKPKNEEHEDGVQL